MRLKIADISPFATNRMLMGILLLSFCQESLAQDVPADLLDLSLEDLFSAEIEDDQSTTQPTTKADRWRFQVKYQRSDFEGYNIGSRELSSSQILFQPGVESRTSETFPVVPSLICQKVQSYSLGYQFNDLLALQVVVPFILQSTDHFSIVPGYERFIIESDGMGDVVLVGSYNLRDLISSNWQLSAGVSLPVGSIDEKGDTPRAPGNQQLPYSMQIGSGTFDIPLGISYNRSGNSFSWGADLTARIRLGENDRNYSLGDRVALNSWVQLDTLSWIKPSLKISYDYSQEIDGLDTDLIVPNAFPFPAPVTDPTLYGGKQANIILGLEIPVSRRQQIDLEIGKPLYQSLNGPQVREKLRFSASMNFRF